MWPTPSSFPLFQPILASIQAYSILAQAVTAYSSYSSLLQPIPAHFSLCQTNPNYSSLFQAIQASQAYSYLFRPIPAYFSLSIQLYDSPIQTIPSVSSQSSLYQKSRIRATQNLSKDARKNLTRIFLLLLRIWLSLDGLLCTLQQSPGLRFYSVNNTALLSYAVHFT